MPFANILDGIPRSRLEMESWRLRLWTKSVDLVNTSAQIELRIPDGQIRAVNRTQWQDHEA